MGREPGGPRPGVGGLVALRVALASAVVLPPTFLMGATLPPMTRALLDRVGAVGREVASLCALNTAGAVAGSLAAGSVLVRAVGVHGTLWLAVAANVAAGAAALALSRRARRRARRPRRPRRIPARTPSARSAGSSSSRSRGTRPRSPPLPARRSSSYTRRQALPPIEAPRAQ